MTKIEAIAHIHEALHPYWYHQYFYITEIGVEAYNDFQDISSKNYLYILYVFESNAEPGTFYMEIRSRQNNIIKDKFRFGKDDNGTLTLLPSL